MPAHYTEISHKDMFEFLTAKGFKPVSIPGTVELVMGKVLTKNWCLRVYTSVARGAGRKVGQDAIRCVIVGRTTDGKIHALKKATRVHRVENWRTNLEKRVETIKEGARRLYKINGGSVDKFIAWREAQNAK